MRYHLLSTRENVWADAQAGPTPWFPVQLFLDWSLNTCTCSLHPPLHALPESTEADLSFPELCQTLAFHKAQWGQKLWICKSLKD